MTRKKHVTITLVDETNCIVGGLEPTHFKHFYEAYGLKAKNHFFHPKFKLGVWDGKIRFFKQGGQTFIFLLDEIVPVIDSLGYEIDIVDKRVRENFITPPLIDEKYFAHIIDPESDEPYVLRDYQVEATNALIESGSGIVIAGTGAGKAQPLTSKVLSITGWKKMGDITIGDILIDPEGGTSNVIGIFPQGKKKIYEIEFDDGAKTRCCSDHLWKVKIPKTLSRTARESKIIDTKTIIDFFERKFVKKIRTPRNISIQMIEPIEKEAASLPLDPYLLGILIGDGCLRYGVNFSTADNEILEKISEILSENDELYIKHIANYDYRIRRKGKGSKKHPLIVILKNLGLFGKLSYEKFIPELYKNSSIEQRTKLLQGLFDSDGYVAKNGRCSFTSTSERLVDDVRNILWSLGARASKKCKETNFYSTNGKKMKGRKSYTIHFSHKNIDSFFGLTRKKELCSSYYKEREICRSLKNVTYVGEEEAQCILLDSENHLYITDDYIVTHNTLINAALVDSYGKMGYSSITIVPSQDLIDQTVDQFDMLDMDVGEYSGNRKDIDHMHVVSTWQALQNNPIILKNFKVFVVDECHGVRSDVLKKLLTEHATHISHRFGLTGTLPKESADSMSVKVSIGSVLYEIPAIKLIEQGYLSKLDIDVIQLDENLEEKYADFLEEGKDFFEKNPKKKPTYRQFKDQYYPEYQAEKAALQSGQEHSSRTVWIVKYLLGLKDQKKGNVFCLVDGVTFGKKLAKMIPDATFVYGKDKKAVRKEIYSLFKNNDNLIVIASIGIASTGLNIKRIFNLVYIDVGKSFIRVIQTIGRGLRKAKDKDYVKVTDISSDLKYGRKHLTQRLKYYKEAGYPYKKQIVKYQNNIDFIEEE